MALSRSTTVDLLTTSLFLLIIIGLVRAPSFFWSVINWDESIYLLISRSMLEGNVLYTDIWDRKQPLTHAFEACRFHPSSVNKSQLAFKTG